MDKVIKAVLVIAGIFIIVLLWLGVKNKPVDLPKAKIKATSAKPEAGVSRPQDEIVKFGSDELGKIDQTMREIKRRRKGASGEEAAALDRMIEMLERAKTKEESLLEEELSSGFEDSAGQEELAHPELFLPEQIMPGEPQEGEPYPPEMRWSEDGLREHPGEYPGRHPSEYPGDYPGQYPEPY